MHHHINLTLACVFLLKMQKILLNRIHPKYCVSRQNAMKHLPAILFAHLVLLAVAHGQTVTLTFDDVSPVDYVIIQNGYGGLQWNNFFIENGSNSPGFYKGAVSPPNVAFNGLGNEASINSSAPFAFISAYLTAVDVGTQQIRVQGFTAGVRRYDNTYTVDGNAPRS